MLCRSLRILKRRLRQQEAVSKQKKFPFDELHTICIKDVRRDILKHDTKLDVMEAVKVNAMENREVLCNRKKNLASQESFFFLCAKFTNRIVSNNAATREGFSFFP